MCGRDAGGIRYGMRCLDDLDVSARGRVAAARDDNPGQRIGPMVRQHLRHGCRRLTRADDYRASPWRRGQVMRKAQRRLCGVDSRLEQPLQQCSGLFHVGALTRRACARLRTQPRYHRPRTALPDPPDRRHRRAHAACAPDRPSLPSGRWRSSRRHCRWCW